MTRHAGLAALAMLGMALPAARAREAEAPHLGTLAADVSRTVLDGRLALRVPAIAADAPGPERNDETRIFVDAGEERLEIRATELFALAGDDFAAAAARVVKSWGRESAAYRVAPLPLGSGLRGAEVVPAEPDRRPTGAFVRGLFVASADGSVQYLEARANAPGARDFAGADALASNILRSVAPGARSLSRDAATSRLTTPLRAVTVFVDVPEGMGTAFQRERDRTVHRFHAPAGLGENAPSLTITFAKDARYLHDRLSREIRPTTREGTIFGQKVLWHAWSTSRAETGKQHLEALVTLGTPGEPLTAHVLVLHRADEGADAMRALVESMRVERRPD